MSSYRTHVCLHCQIANKRGAPCPECHRPMECIGHSWRAPRRGDKAGWKKMLLFVQAKRRLGMAADVSPTVSSNHSFNPFHVPPKVNQRTAAEDAYRNRAWLNKKLKALKTK